MVYRFYMCTSPYKVDPIQLVCFDFDRQVGTSCPDRWVFCMHTYQVMDDEDDAESTLQTISDATTTTEGKIDGSNIAPGR